MMKIFFFADVYPRKEAFESEWYLVSRLDGISSVIYNRIPLPFQQRFDIKSGAKPFNLKKV